MDMLEKIIKPCAIVPPKLYVLRDADQQLRQIIHDMGRPGYVLVSRQMGKTNLLLNAKRETDSENDIFAYLDVSNSFSDIRDFFRNIVDTILEGEIKCFSELTNTIQESRKQSINLQPHKEHEFELRTILDSIKGKLIICLDEIDALTKVDYSDKVFSQIRSMYFSGRTNFSVFSRLTYVLSGVADPSELIKNKAISPFNIGAKIYLNDFTLQETLHFVAQCAMNLGVEIVERIYHWTSGNPRVTWEICSELESKLIAGDDVGPPTVDDLVRSLYLANFDLPPVDHIRTIVSADREISNAVMSLHYGKSNSLTDKMKDRLYLAGVTTSKSTDGSIKFRNKIVAEALSERWISDLEKSLLTVSERILQYFDAEEYDSIISLYEKSDEAEFENISVSTQFKIGYAYVKSNLHLQALNIFKTAAKIVDTGDDFYILNYWMGICNLVTDDVKRAIENFSTIVYRESGRSQGIDYFQSCMNLSVAYFRELYAETYSPTHDEKVTIIISTLNVVIDSEQEISRIRSEAIAKQLCYTAHYQLHSLYAWKGDVFSALACLEKGLEACLDSSAIKFLIAKSALTQEPEKKFQPIENCVEKIIEQQFEISTNQQNALLLTRDDCLKILYTLARTGSYDSFSKLVNYMFETEEKQGYSCASLLHSAVLRAARVKDFNAIFWITNSAVALLTGRAAKDELRKLISLSLVLATDIDVGNLKEKFIQDFLFDDSALPISDISAIYVIIMLEIENNNLEAAKNIIDKSIAGWNKTIEEGDEGPSWKLADCVLRYLEVLISTLQKNTFELSQAISLREEISTIKNQTLPYFTKDANTTIIKTLDTIIHLHKQVLIQKSLDGISRKSSVTVRMTDGRIVSGKLKKLLPMIKSGAAELISSTLI